MSEYTDQTLVCEDCGQEFTFKSGEQEFYATKGFSAPKRCDNCRRAKKDTMKKQVSVICAACGQETTVPFQPTGDRPVYCRDCFLKQKQNG